MKDPVKNDKYFSDKIKARHSKKVPYDMYCHVSPFFKNQFSVQSRQELLTGGICLSHTKPTKIKYLHGCLERYDIIDLNFLCPVCSIKACSK